MSRQRRPRRLGVVALAGMLVGALALGIAGGGGVAAALRKPEPPAPLEPAVLIEPQAAPALALPATEARMCSVDWAINAPAALNFRGVIVNAETDEVLFEREPHTAVTTASTMKLITAVTAMTVLGPDTRFPTRVVPGDVPGSVVLVGGGDPTLRSGATSYYQDAAGMSDLAAQVQGAGGASIVGTDDSLFSGAAWQPTWDDIDRVDGYIAPISALMVDAGRRNPNDQYSTRTTTSERDAGAALAGALRATLSESVAPMPGAAPIAEVWSPPVSELVGVMLLDSDNVIAETLARLVAIELGVGNDFGAVNAAQQQALAAVGLDVSAFFGADGSGLSPDNQANATLLLEVLDLIQTSPELSGLRELLPQNQLSGTLKDRMFGIPAGAIAAKTGFINAIYALAGWAELPDGTTLRFALFVERDAGSTTPVNLGNRAALDEIVTAVYACGTSLSNN
ncbi:D-alanyl-D-alanine carboxypeptidase/D-alanyl-D-alanine-endopeptidase [Gulosibacter macacae]|nr:D-alanyl-D-alanine carboxypeptidase [Gulosibacter macacae]